MRAEFRIYSKSRCAALGSAGKIMTLPVPAVGFVGGQAPIGIVNRGNAAR
jgi:hypothetical protein